MVLNIWQLQEQNIDFFNCFMFLFYFKGRDGETLCRNPILFSKKEQTVNFPNKIVESDCKQSTLKYIKKNLNQNCLANLNLSIF